MEEIKPYPIKSTTVKPNQNGNFYNFNDILNAKFTILPQGIHPKSMHAYYAYTRVHRVHQFKNNCLMCEMEDDEVKPDIIVEKKNGEG